MATGKIPDKKPRGRPKKIEKDEGTEYDGVNEQSLSIKMSSQKVDSPTTVQQIQNQWTNIFSKYSGSFSFNTIASAWNAGFLNNPFIQNQRIKQISTQPINISKKDLQEATQNPQENEEIFRQESIFLNHTNYVYNGIIRNNRDIPHYYYYYIPQYVKAQDMKKDDFKKESQKVDKIVKVFRPSLTFKTIAMQVAEEGKCTYVIRKSFDDKLNKVYLFNLQKLNSDQVKLTGLGSKQPYIASFNFMIFLNPMYSLSQYPPYFTEIFEKLKTAKIFIPDKDGKLIFNKKIVDSAEMPENSSIEYGKGGWMFWYQLSQYDAYTFCADASHPLVIPETTGMLVDMSELTDYKALQTALLAKTVTSILAATVPMDKAAKTGLDQTLLSPDLILGYEGHFGNNVAGNVMPFFAPFTDYKFFSVDNQPDNMDVVYNRIRDLIATSGNSALNTISDKPSIASVKAAQRLAASKARYLSLQFESFLDQVINEQFDLKYDWKFYLWGDCYNDDDLKIAKEMLLGGMKVMLPKVLSAEGYTLEDGCAIQDYLSILGIQTEFGAAANKTAAIKKVGRPALDENEIENDSTGISVDQGNNVSDIKNFEHQYVCRICGAEIDEDDNGICDDCLEEEYDKRLEAIIKKQRENKIDKEINDYGEK